MVGCRTAAPLARGPRARQSAPQPIRPAAGACRQRYRGKLRVPKAILRLFAIETICPPRNIKASTEAARCVVPVFSVFTSGNVIPALTATSAARRSLHAASCDAEPGEATAGCELSDESNVCDGNVSE